MSNKKNRVKTPRIIKVVEEKRYEIEEVFNLLKISEMAAAPIELPPRPEKGGWKQWREERKKKTIELDGHPVYSFSKRYLTFYLTGTKCHCCARKATHFRLEGAEGNPRRHFELYDDEGMLFTKKAMQPQEPGILYQEGDYITFCRECNNAAHRELQNKTSD